MREPNLTVFHDDSVEELEGEAFGLYVHCTPAFSAVCKLLSPVNGLLEEVAGMCSRRLQSPTVPQQCPARLKPVLCLFLHGALRRAWQVHWYLVVLELYIVCSLLSDHTLHSLWVAVERTDWDGHCG